MLEVTVGSKNPVKINAVRKAFAHFPLKVSAIAVHSGVSSQPFSDEETLSGAVKRAKAACTGTASFGIGLEGGVDQCGGQLYVCNWGALYDNFGRLVVAGGGKIPLPEEIAFHLRTGEELGEAIDRYAGSNDVRRGVGAIGVLTGGKVDREAVYIQLLELVIGQYEYQYGAIM